MPREKAHFARIGLITSQPVHAGNIDEHILGFPLWGGNSPRGLALLQTAAGSQQKIWPWIDSSLFVIRRRSRPWISPFSLAMKQTGTRRRSNVGVLVVVRYDTPGILAVDHGLWVMPFFFLLAHHAL